MGEGSPLALSESGLRVIPTTRNPSLSRARAVLPPCLPVTPNTTIVLSLFLRDILLGWVVVVVVLVVEVTVELPDGEVASE